MIFKKIAGFCFGLAFLSAIVLFTGIGSSIIPLSVARILFMVFGGAGMVLNLVAFRYGKHDPEFNLLYWLGSVVVFIGLILMMMHWSFALYIVIIGAAVTGFSFIYTPNLFKEDDSDELLDQ
jgi:hypothetical protein